MPEPTTSLLVSTAGATALVHTLIPDHWLPFVLVGRARGWEAEKVAAVSGLSAMIHAALSVVLGLAALWVGERWAAAWGERLETVGAVLLVAFGAAYALWAWRKRGHFHPGGWRLHRAAGVAECAAPAEAACPEHLHYHADEELIRERPLGWGALGLALVIGLNPCILILPLLVASAAHGTEVVVLTMAAYLVPTVLLMVGLSVAGVVIGGDLRLPWPARWMEVGSGLLVALVGLLYWALDH